MHTKITLTYETLDCKRSERDQKLVRTAETIFCVSSLIKRDAKLVISRRALAAIAASSRRSTRKHGRRREKGDVQNASGTRGDNNREASIQ